MQIVVFSWRDIKHPSAGGAEIATHEHLKYWAKKGHRVTVFSSSFLCAKNSETIDGVRFVRKGNQLGTVYIYAWLWYLKLKNKPDLIVDQIHGIGFLAPMFSSGVPVLAYIHEVAKEVWFMNHLKFPLNYIYGAIGYIVEPLMFKTVYRNCGFMTVSKSTKKDLVDVGIPAKSISIIPNGVLTVKTKIKKNKNRTAVFLGAIAKDKGIFDAINCFAAIHKKDADWEFWIVGKGALQIVEEFKNLSKNLSIESKLIYWGFVSDKRKFELLAKAHVMINPSKREGWGIVNIEANSMGTPVVGYDVAGTRDSVIDGKTGTLCTKGDWNCLAESAMSITSSREKYSAISRNVVKWSGKFVWEKSTKESLDLVESLLSR